MYNFGKQKTKQKFPQANAEEKVLHSPRRKPY